MKITIHSIVLLLFLSFNAYTQVWNSLGPGLNALVATIAVNENNVYAGGLFTDAGGDPDADYLAHWDGRAWQAVGPGINGAVHAIAIHGDEIYIGGDFTLPFNHIAKWDGVQWGALGSGLDGSVFDIKLDGIDVYAGGSFPGRITVWDGNSWSIVGSGVNSTVYTIEINGTDIYIGGSFFNAGGNIHADRIAKWNGNTWENLGSGFPRNSVADILVHGTDIYVCGSFLDCPPSGPDPFILRWDGTDYFELGDKNECRTGSSMSLVGDYLYVGVIDFISADAGIHRWNMINHTWEDFIGGWVIGDPGYYTDIALATNGSDLYVGHSFTKLGGQDVDNIARCGEAEITGIKENTGAQHATIRVFPNPSNDIIYFDTGIDRNSVYRITLTDAKGEIVSVSEIRKRELNINQLPAGLYFLHVQTEGVNGVAKVIKL